MMDASELYQSIILDHNRAPRNFRAMPEATGESEGYNPLCGDRIKVWLRVQDDRIVDVSFQGSGCAISKASASLMTAAVKGKTRAEAEQLIAAFHDVITGSGCRDDLPAALTALGGVREYPARVKCATLSWHALKSALDGGRPKSVRGSEIHL
ncbi:MAG TPA: SUF system NifU family Fe-S cluster assembly protein [Gemmatimonadales bacterium]|nr:SUF system NifU family Fe-S cluster assembly protein [Gemmatimonadales bacterium]